MQRAAILAFVLMATVAIRAEQAAPEAHDGFPGFVVWSEARIQAAAEALEKKLGTNRMVFETIGNYPGHSIYLVLRGATDAPEFHETEKDLYIVRKGTATFVIGGELEEEFRKPRKQRSGTGIKGGIKRELVPGDLVHVPMMIPHQLQITPGKPFMYILVHFDEEPLLPRPNFR